MDRYIIQEARNGSWQDYHPSKGAQAEGRGRRLLAALRKLDPFAELRLIHRSETIIEQFTEEEGDRIDAAKARIERQIDGMEGSFTVPTGRRTGQRHDVEYDPKNQSKALQWAHRPCMT